MRRHFLTVLLLIVSVTAFAKTEIGPKQTGYELSRLLPLTNNLSV